ncbi:MAG: hypothetical protein IT539_06215 [Bradyrhizobiaceae bacterium]|nr:hypothetical protein [Bradyrhizobiaceae bacterium]
MSTLTQNVRFASTQRIALLAIGGVAALLVAAAAILWMKLGTAVFFDVVRAGIAYCF